MACSAVDPRLGGAVLLYRMEIRAWRNRGDRPGHLNLHDSSTLQGTVAVHRSSRVGRRHGARYGKMKRPVGIVAFATIVALLLAAHAVTPLVRRVAAQQEPAAPGRGQSVADTLEAIQQAR